MQFSRVTDCNGSGRVDDHWLLPRLNRVETTFPDEGVGRRRWGGVGAREDWIPVNFTHT